MSKTLKIKPLISHDYKLIPVPSERLGKYFVSDFEFLESKNEKFKIIDVIEILRGQQIPTILTVLSIGQFLSSEDIFKIYKKSNKIYFFLCEKLESNMI